MPAPSNTAPKRRTFLKRPVFTYIITQLFLWILAYGFLSIIVYLVLLTAIPGTIGYNVLKASLLLAIYFGFFNGLFSALTDLFFQRRFFLKRSLGVIILIKAVISFFVFVVLISFIRYSIYPFLLRRYFPQAEVVTSQLAWDSFFQFLLLFTITTSVIISFYNQVNKKFGPGILLPLFLGRYRRPREQERIFLFMDLSASTSIAENLGHLRFSAFIRDCFLDINALIPKFRGQIYQYIGDEVVLIWPPADGLKNLNCVRFFFACTARFSQRSSYYLHHYGQVPRFKAGLHMGMVTAVEIGDIKRDIGYHGDTVNTAARIQEMCNHYHSAFLTSSVIAEHCNSKDNYQVTSLGFVPLKGKAQSIELFRIEEGG